ncbi:hypothetical protein FPQ18DRAFT_391615 [Pyronema domesticum]|nr:hypothetical protein FPQ18DRAFT_391615 [Pyronema domesticum]
MNPSNRNLRDISRSNRRITLPTTNTNQSHPNERRNSLPTTNTDQVDAEEKIEQLKDDMQEMKELQEDEVQRFREEIEGFTINNAITQPISGTGALEPSSVF